MVPMAPARLRWASKLGAADLTSNDIQSLSDEALAQTVHNGKGKMPAFDKDLSAGRDHAA